MKVGEDAVILGSWFNGGGARTLIDIGSGTGILSLMAAQRFPHCEITAIEINQKAFEDLSLNVTSSKFKTISCKLQNVFEHEGVYDLVLCNPPFFEAQLTSPNADRRIARQEMSMHELIRQVTKLSHTSTRFAMIIPFNRKDEVCKIAHSNGWWLQRSLAISPIEHKPPHRIALEFVQDNEVILKEEKLMVRKGGVYAPIFVALTSDFYLNH